MDTSLFTKKGEAYRDGFTAFLRKNDLISCSETFNLADYFLTDQCSREIAKSSLKHNSAAVISAHNHPSGNPSPSVSDKQITLRLKEALELLRRYWTDIAAPIDTICVTATQTVPPLEY